MLRRITGLLLTVALAQLSLGAVPYCASGDMTASSAPHEGMSMPDGGSPDQSKQCDSCDQTPSAPQAPCDHGFQGACATMTSCATLAVESQVLLPSPPVRLDDAVVSAITTPPTVALSLDTPPPRV